MTRPSRHCRRVRTKYGRRIQLINPHLHRRAQAPAFAQRQYAAGIIRRLERDNEALQSRQFHLGDYLYRGPVKLTEQDDAKASVRRTIDSNTARIRWLKGVYDL